MSSGIKKPEPADCHAFMQWVVFNACMMTSEWFRWIQVGMAGIEPATSCTQNRRNTTFLHPVIFFISYHNHICMSTFAYINPWYEPMAGNAPASMLYENTVLLLNYTGIDAHTVKQHGSSIMISCAHMQSCRDDIVPWMEFESMAFWFGIKRSIHWAIRTIKAASRIGLYLQWTRKWKHCLHPTGSYHESVINRLIKPPRAIHIPFPDVGSAIAITTCSDQPACDRALDRNCTCDPELRRFLLCLLSYKGGIISSDLHMFSCVRQPANNYDSTWTQWCQIMFSCSYKKICQLLCIILLTVNFHRISHSLSCVHHHAFSWHQHHVACLFHHGHESYPWNQCVHNHQPYHCNHINYDIKFNSTSDGIYHDGIAPREWVEHSFDLFWRQAAYPLATRYELIKAWNQWFIYMVSCLYTFAPRVRFELTTFALTVRRFLPTELTGNIQFCSHAHIMYSKYEHQNDFCSHSITILQSCSRGAYGNWNHVFSVQGKCSTTELMPRTPVSRRD